MSERFVKQSGVTNHRVAVKLPGRVVSKDVISALAALLIVTVEGNSYWLSRIFLLWHSAIKRDCMFS